MWRLLREIDLEGKIVTLDAGLRQWQTWQWKGWTLNTPLKEGADNVLKISERENAKADVICIRDDNQTPTDEEYEKYLEEHKTQKIAVRQLEKLITIWGRIKSGGR